MARPTKEPTDEQRKQVQTLAGYGLSQEQIARMLGLHRNTLKKHCAKELEMGKDMAYTQALNSLFSNIKKGKEASIFFYLKTQAGWREKPPEQGEDKEPPPPATVNLIFLPKPEK